MVLEDDILIIDYNESIFKTDLVLSEPEQFIVDELNNYVRIVLSNIDIDFVNDEQGFFSYYNTKTKIFYLSYRKIWSVLDKKYGYNNHQINNLTLDLMLKVFKYRVTTTWSSINEAD